MGLDIDQPTRARNRRVIRRRFVQRQVQELANRERICGAPRDASLRIDPLEVADQQQSEIHTGREAGASHGVGVKRPARSFDERVELTHVEHRIHASIERVRRRRRQLGGRDPEIVLTSSLASGAHRHRRQCSTLDRSCRSLPSTFHRLSPRAARLRRDTLTCSMRSNFCDSRCQVRASYQSPQFANFRESAARR